MVQPDGVAGEVEIECEVHGAEDEAMHTFGRGQRFGCQHATCAFDQCQHRDAGADAAQPKHRSRSFGLRQHHVQRTGALQQLNVVVEPRRRFVVDAHDEAGTVAHRLPGPRNRGGRAGYVQYVCTEAKHRGRGLGRAVMEALVDWYRANGVGVVELHATADGEPLYRSMGFDEGDNPALRLPLP